MTISVLAMLALAACGSCMAADAVAGAAPTAKPYTLDTCIVTGEKLGSMGEPVVVVREGREIKFCCKGCIKDFDKNTAKFLKEIDAAERAAAAAKAAVPGTATPPTKRACCP